MLWRRNIGECEAGAAGRRRGGGGGGGGGGHGLAARRRGIGERSARWREGRTSRVFFGV